MHPACVARKNGSQGLNAPKMGQKRLAGVSGQSSPKQIMLGAAVYSLAAHLAQ
jgi:hypothetical protein